MLIILNTLGGLYYSQGAGSIESFLGFLLIIFIVSYFLTRKKQNKPKQTGKIECRKDVLGQDVPVYCTNDNQFKPINKFSFRVAVSVLFFIITFVAIYKNAPIREQERQNTPSYRYTDLTYIETTPHVYDTSHFNLNRAYKRKERIYSYHYQYENLHETPKYRIRKPGNLSSKTYDNPLWNLH